MSSTNITVRLSASGTHNGVSPLPAPHTFTVPARDVRTHEVSVSTTYAPIANSNTAPIRGLLVVNTNSVAGYLRVTIKASVYAFFYIPAGGFAFLPLESWRSDLQATEVEPTDVHVRSVSGTAEYRVTAITR